MVRLHSICLSISQIECNRPPESTRQIETQERLLVYHCSKSFCNNGDQMRDLILDVLDNFAQTRASLFGVAKVADTPDHNALLKNIPDRITAHLIQRGVADLYKVKGSIGQGNIARAPWVGIFRKVVTESAEKGYYIVLLFSEDMSSCFLSLNQGITAVERLYTQKFAWKKMREAADRAAFEIERHPLAILDRIDMKATGDLAKGYSHAAIESFYYSRLDLPDNPTFFEHFDHLIDNYERLIRKFGGDLFRLFEISEGEFQQVALAKAAMQDGASDELENGPEIDLSVMLGTMGGVRSPRVAATALRNANFECEIDPTHWTFTSRARSQKYVEAHHLIPISQQPKFVHSLDIVANVVSLCATCHRLLHYGLEQERKSLLRTLFKARKDRLSEKSIAIRDRDFLKFYGSDSLLED